MLLLPLLALFSLPLCLAAMSKDQAHTELMKLAAANDGIITIDDRTFELLTMPNRDWSATVVFTALDPRRKCSPCKTFQPSYDSVAKSWKKVPAAERNQHFFAFANFDDAMTTFQKLGIQSAPIVMMYPATEGPRKPANGKFAPLTYDFAQGYDAEPLAEQLSRHTPVRIPYSPPTDWTKYILSAVLILLGAITLRFIAPILQSRLFWAGTTIVITLTMIAGQMFVRIREMPYAGGDGQWIASNYSNQFGQEVTVVAMLYGLLAGSFLFLTMVVPYQTSPGRQQMQVWLWSATIFIIFSVLVSLFRVKNRGYPFKLLL